MTQQLETPLYDSIAASFEIASLQSGNDRLLQLRKEAMDHFKRLGFPSIRHEEWKYTNVLPLIKSEYELNADKNSEISVFNYEKAVELIKKHQCDILPALKGEHKGAYRIVIINGKLNEQLSFVPDKEKVNIMPITHSSDSDTFNRFFGTIAHMEDNAFAALNTALFNSGIILEVAKGIELDMPIHIINVFSTETNALIQPRNLFVINANAKVEIIETDIAEQQGHQILVNGVTEIHIAENAVFDHYDLQKGEQELKKIQRTECAQERYSNYGNYTFTLPGSEFVRNNLSVHLNQSDIETHLYGLYLASGKQLVDNHTEIHHKKPNCQSNQLYKGVLLDHSKAVFNGKILVYQDAQKTNAFQQSNNILFSETATVNAKPQLEIYADDVKCSHGTTMGQIDDESLFYLRSRGISENSAKTMMVHAFAYDVIQKVKIPALRTYLENIVAFEMEQSK